jgi:hypothetical protein
MQFNLLLFIIYPIDEYLSQLKNNRLMNINLIIILNLIINILIHHVIRLFYLFVIYVFYLVTHLIEGSKILNF